MLAYLNSFVVPEVDNITVYPDDMNPYKFYCIRSIPRLVKDSATKDPLFHYTSIGRKADNAVDASQQAIGLLNMTVSLAPTEDELKKISSYIAYNKNNAHFTRMKELYPKHKDYRGSTAIVFGTPEWDKGTAELLLAKGSENNFLTVYDPGAIQPSLVGYNQADFNQSFSDEGDRLMYQLLQSIIKKESTDINASVRYDVEFFAHIPSLELEIVLHLDKIYDQLNEMYDELDKTRSGGTTYKRSGSSSSYTDTRTINSTRDEISDVIKGWRNNSSLEININNLANLSDQEKSEWADGIIESFLNVITNKVLDSLFTEIPVDEAEVPENTATEAGEKDRTTPDQKTKVSDAELDRPNVHVRYKLHDHQRITEMGEIRLSLKESSVKRVSKSPQGLLYFDDLNDNQRTKLLSIVNLDHDVHKFMFIPVGTNADFEKDGILSVDVELRYEQYNAATKMPIKVSKMFSLTSNEDRYSFNFNAARDQKGDFLTSYKYRSRVVFKGRSLGANGGWSDFVETDRTEMIVSYGAIGYQRVRVSGENFDIDYLKDAMVHLEYLGAPGKPDTVADIKLTPDEKAQTWKCFRYYSNDERYRYSVTYHYQDGTEYTVGPFEDTAEDLQLWDPFNATKEIEFNTRIGQGLLNAKLEVSFKDGNYERKATHDIPIYDKFDSWRWTTRIRPSGKPVFKYRTLLYYEEGDPVISDWTPIKDDFVNIEIKSDPNAKPDPISSTEQLQIVTTGINWDNWQFVFLYIVDDTNKKQTITLPDPATGQTLPIITVEITYSSEGRGACLISGTFLGKDNVPVNMKETECSASVFILKDPKAKRS